MIRGHNEIVRFCVEGVRGETPGTPTWLQPDLHGEGFRMREMRGVAELFLSSSFPELGRAIKNSKTFEGRFVTPLFTDFAEEVIKIAALRTSGLMDSYTFHHKKGSVEEIGYKGVLAQTLRLSWGANDEPVIAALDLVALRNDETVSGITAGTYPTGDVYMGSDVTVSVDGTSYDNLEGELTIENNPDVKGPGTNKTPIAIKEGVQRVGIALRASEETDAILTELRGSDFVPVIVTLKSGVGNDLVFTMAQVEIVEAPEEGDDIGADVEQPLTGVAWKPSGGNQLVITYP